jgi:hypothetical protein
MSSIMVNYIITERKYVSRTTDPTYINEDVIIQWKDHESAWANRMEMPTIPSAENYYQDWPHAFKDMEQYFDQRLSNATKVTLSYLIRANVAVPDENDDPETNYSSWNEEQVARCPHYDASGVHTPFYVADNQTLWSILYVMFYNQDSYTHMKRFAKSCDGRGAYKALKDFYLSTRKVQNHGRNIDARLSRLVFTGHNKKLSFHKYITAHRVCHSQLNGLKEHGYSGIDESSTVRPFLDGIKYGPLVLCKGAVFSSPALSKDFERAVDLYNNYILGSHDLKNNSLLTKTWTP